MSRTNNVFVENYSDIISEVHISECGGVKFHENGDYCCVYFVNTVCSPILVPMWILCCFGVTTKKMYKCCRCNNVNKNDIADDTISTQPK